MYSEKSPIYKSTHHCRKEMLAPIQVWAFSYCMSTGVWRYLQNSNKYLKPTPSFCCVAKLFNMEKVKRQVNSVLRCYNERNTSALQQQLYELYLNFNKTGSGKYIINYPNKDELAECFTLMLRFDWINDADIRKVWAENGFYCIVEYITGQAHTPLEKATAGLDLFIHLCVAQESLKPKIQTILNRAVVLQNPIFKDHYINNNANYLIDQFLYLSAKLARPLLLINEDFLMYDLRTIYNSILKNEYIEKQTSPYHILEKAKFISAVIETVLEGM